MSSTALVSPVHRLCWALLPRGTCGPGARVQPRCAQVLTGTNAVPQPRPAPGPASLATLPSKRNARLGAAE